MTDPPIFSPFLPGGRTFSTLLYGLIALLLITVIALIALHVAPEQEGAILELYKQATATAAGLTGFGAAAQATRDAATGGVTSSQGALILQSRATGDTAPAPAPGVTTSSHPMPASADTRTVSTDGGGAAAPG